MAHIDAFLAGDGPPPTWLSIPLEAPRARGLGLAGLPEVWRPLLSRAGVPLASGQGVLVWGRDLAEGDGDHLGDDGGRLLLPTPTAFAALGSLALRPLRELVARRLGLRLKIGAGVHLRCWDGGALLLNGADMPLGGFLVGPRPGSRTGIMLAPGAYQTVSW